MGHICNSRRFRHGVGRISAEPAPVQGRLARVMSSLLASREPSRAVASWAMYESPCISFRHQMQRRQKHPTALRSATDRPVGLGTSASGRSHMQRVACDCVTREQPAFETMRPHAG